MEDFLSKGLPAFLVSFGIAVAFAWFSRKAKEAPDDGLLVYGAEVKALAWLSSTVAFAFLIFMYVADHGGQYVAISFLAAMFGLLGVYLLTESYGTTGYFNDQEIFITSLWVRKRIAQWAQLQRASFKKNGQYFELVFSDGTKISLSKMLHGHRAVREHVESLGVNVENWPTGEAREKK